MKNILFQIRNDNEFSDEGSPRLGLVALTPELIKRVKLFQGELKKLQKIDHNVSNITLVDYTPNLFEMDAISPLAISDDLEDEADKIETEFDQGAEFIEVSDEFNEELEKKQPIEGDSITLVISSDSFWWEGSVRHADVNWVGNRIPITILD